MFFFFISQNGEDADEDEPLDVEGDSYEEYEWAGQRRVRASTLLEGGFAGNTHPPHPFPSQDFQKQCCCFFVGVGMQVCKTAGDEETEEVVVDGDDTAAFGPAQFAEGDIHSAVAAAADSSPSIDEGNHN